MELRKSPLNFIQPLLHTLKKTTNIIELDDDQATFVAEVMPILDVINLIHQAYYFNQAVCITYEVKNSTGYIDTLQVVGTVQTPISQANRFAFQPSHASITNLLSLEQVLSVSVVHN